MDIVLVRIIYLVVPSERCVLFDLLDILGGYLRGVVLIHYGQIETDLIYSAITIMDLDSDRIGPCIPHDGRSAEDTC